MQINDRIVQSLSIIGCLKEEKSMGKKKTVKAIVDKPEAEALENIVAESVAKIIMLRINKLPENQRLPSLEKILKKLEEREE